VPATFTFNLARDLGASLTMIDPYDNAGREQAIQPARPAERRPTSTVDARGRRVDTKVGSRSQKRQRK
jgi:hypothetical protein